MAPLHPLMTSNENPMTIVDQLVDAYPFKWMAPFVLASGEDKQNEAQTIEKWLLVGFCSICILAMIVCVVILIVYKVRKSRRDAAE